MMKEQAGSREGRDILYCYNGLMEAGWTFRDTKPHPPVPNLNTCTKWHMNAVAVARHRAEPVLEQGGVEAGLEAVLGLEFLNDSIAVEIGLVL